MRKNSLDCGIYSHPHTAQQVTNSTADRPLRASEVAALFAVGRDTLRHYERCGLLQPPGRSSRGYRLYGKAAVERVRLIRGALAIGFTLEELKRILQQRDCGNAPCAEVLELAQEKLAQMNEQIGKLTRLRNGLKLTLAEWTPAVKHAAGRRAGLLESFVTSHPEAARALSPQVSPGLARKFKKDEVKNDIANRNGSSRSHGKRRG